MPYLVGMDEAGYAPNLGPLTISATVWWVPDGPDGVDLYRRLAKVVCRTHSPNGRRLAIADSKVLYSPRLGVGPLERGLLPAFALSCGLPTSWQSAWDILLADPDRERERLAWHVGYDMPLPIAITPADVERLAKRFDRGLSQAGVRLERIRSRAVFPEQFNALIERYGTKGAALSKLTLGLLSDILAELRDEPVLVVCDKHGGRNFYGELLQVVFPERLVEVHRESRALSIYRWGPPDARIEVRFIVEGESFLPVALASMTCKYLRELSMRAFNDYWCACVPNLRPTAGYPTDALRFKRQIAAAQRGLGIDDRVLWRSR